MKRAQRALVLAKTLARYIVRRSAPVTFNDLANPTPVSRSFGGDRGLPVDRFYIERFLNNEAAAIKGRVIEIGSRQYTEAYGRGVVCSDVLHATDDNDKATIVGDLTRTETLPASSYDCMICTQTLGFIFDPGAAVRGIAHLLRPGGVVLATVAGISQVSRYDMERWGDYWRFTDASIRRVFEGVFGDAVEVRAYGNVAAAIALLQGISVEDLPDRDVLDQGDADYQVILTIRASKPA